MLCVTFFSHIAQFSHSNHPKFEVFYISFPKLQIHKVTRYRWYQNFQISVRHYNLSSANFLKCVLHMFLKTALSHILIMFIWLFCSSIFNIPQRHYVFLFIPVLGEGSMKGHEVICYLLIWNFSNSIDLVN